MPEASNPRALKSRLRDWWHGEDSIEEPETESEPAGWAEAPRVETDAPQQEPGVEGRTWTADSVAAVQMVCGAGSSIPGGETFAEASIRHMGLRETMSVVDYGSQLGLLARVIAQKTGAWVDAVEPVSLLATEATRLAELKRVGKKVTVKHCELLKAPVKNGSRDAVISVEMLHRSPEHVAQFQNIARMLKLGGRVLMVDYFRKSELATTPAISHWRQEEGLRPDMPELNETRAAMEAARIRIQVSEDITPAYCDHLTAGLRRLARQIAEHPPESAMRSALLREVHFWGTRLQVLQAGDVAVLRLSASLGR